MNDLKDPAKSQASNDAARIYEFSDFVPLAPGAVYVQVRHQRTIFQTDGSVRKESVGKEILLERMVRAFRGKAFHSAGTLNAFFDDVEQAKSCANAIIVHHGLEPELCGTHLTISVVSED
ncbi:hypothetical protein [Methyloterricola oryzae]|uniref:hypothetical protein n=1 Tax=Methyloterricola oryzae TaxID=1495050 RepID=UPI0011AF3844|nr:hypothetical protein [Methyloterricola oryzae]